MDIIFGILDFIHFFIEQNQGFFTIFEIVGAFLLGLAMRARGLGNLTIFLQVSLFIVKIVQWWLKTHPHGKKIAQDSAFDEQINQLYDEKLKVHDSVPYDPNVHQ